MTPTAASGDGGLKLRGLLHQGRELLRERHLKRAVTNAQIAYDFASRSGDAPDVADAAQLILAEAAVLQAHYAFDVTLADADLRAIERRHGGTAPRSTVSFELTVLRAEQALLRRDAAFAKTLLAALFAQDVPTAARARTWLAYAEAHVLSGDLAGARRALTEAEARCGEAAGRPCLDRARLHYLRARIAIEAEDVPVALAESSQALALAKAADQPELVADAARLLGATTAARGNLEIALRILYESLEAAERCGSGPAMLATHLEIARVYEVLRYDAEAAKHFHAALAPAERFGRHAEAYAANLALARAAQRLGRAAEATDFLARALRSAQAALGPYEAATVLGELAYVQWGQGATDLASHYAVAARRSAGVCSPASPAVAGDAPPPEGHAPARLHLVEALVHVHRGDAPSGLASAARARSRALAEDLPEIAIEADRLTARALEASGEFAGALEAERRAAQLSDQTHARRRNRQLGDLDMRAALQQSEREIERLTRESGLKSALLSKSDEVERANAELLQANEDLRQFAFVASHDLKEPLRQIGSYVGLLRRKCGARLDEDGRAYLDFVSDGAARLNRLFDSLMHYTSVARQDKISEDVDLGRLFDHLCRERASLLEARGARVAYERLPRVQTGGALLRHVCDALLDNALKFVPHDRSPEVTIAAEAEGDAYLIRITDNGIGLAQAYREKVFQLFQMLHAKGEYPGTGVGLAVAHKTIQRLGGRLWYEDRADGLPGVSFCFTLPMGVERRLDGAGVERGDSTGLTRGGARVDGGIGGAEQAA